MTRTTQSIVATMFCVAIVVAWNTFLVSKNIVVMDPEVRDEPTVLVSHVQTQDNEEMDTIMDDELASTTPNQTKPRPIPVDDRPIRSWGCDLTETPLIFVHNGKSGGGAIRARLAASAQNVTRGNFRNQRDQHFYPIPDKFQTPNAVPYDNTANRIRHGRFCNSQYPHVNQMPHIQAPLADKTFEGLAFCNATTPLGLAVACHQPYRLDQGRGGGIQLGHYQNANCGACDDDYYLEAAYYFPPRNFYKTAAPTKRRLLEVATKSAKQRERRRRRQGKGNIPTFSDSVLDHDQDPPPGSTCDTVLTAHLNIGSELTWLPPRYLKKHWWDGSEYKEFEQLDSYWERLLDDRQRRRAKLKLAAMKYNGIESTRMEPVLESERWCPAGYVFQNTTLYDRPSTKLQYIAAYNQCIRPLAEDADRAFRKAFAGTNYSPFYASMPLHRVTVMRDPWAWIISKFFWHKLAKAVPKEDGVIPCSYVTFPATSKSKSEFPPTDPFDPTRQIGWVEQFSLLYLIKLCGDDCRIRYENGMMTLEEIEEQVSSNLRNAFSVVGLLQEQFEFYDMLTDRIAYVNMELHPEMQGDEHSTAKTKNNILCKELFAHNETFREEVREQVPAFAALERMYHLGIRVNAFQKEELRQCKLAKGQEPTKGTYPRN